MTKLEKNLQLKKQLNFFWAQTRIYPFLSLHKGRPSYKRSYHPSKENIQHSKTWNFLHFFYFCGSWIRIRIRWPDWIRIQSGSGSATLASGANLKLTFDLFFPQPGDGASQSWNYGQENGHRVRKFILICAQPEEVLVPVWQSPEVHPPPCPTRGGSDPKNSVKHC